MKLFATVLCLIGTTLAMPQSYGGSGSNVADSSSNNYGEVSSGLLAASNDGYQVEMKRDKM